MDSGGTAPSHEKQGRIADLCCGTDQGPLWAACDCRPVRTANTTLATQTAFLCAIVAKACMKPEAGPRVLPGEIGHGPHVPSFGAPADETTPTTNDLGPHDVLFLTIDADTGNAHAYRVS